MKFNTKAIHGGQKHDPAYGAVMPPIYQTSTYAQSTPGGHKGFEYSRTHNPTRAALEAALASIEDGNYGLAFGSGLAAIDAVMKLLSPGDEVISTNDLYGGTYRLFTKIFERFGIKFHFVGMSDVSAIEAKINQNTKLIWVETPTNPMMNVVDIVACAAIAKKHQVLLAVDNTFATPYLQQPLNLGADIVMHSLTKFINGSSDTMGGVICGTQGFIDQLRNVNDGACMLLGASMDSLRAASILKNLRTLHIRIKQHSHNAMYLAQKFEADGLKTVYPGLKSHPSHALFSRMMNPEYGYGGMLTIDAGDLETANKLMELMQERNLGYLAVSLGFYKTLFSAPGSSTSSEIPLEEQMEMGLTDGLIRFSIGLDNDIERTYQMMRQCTVEVGVLS